MQGMKHIMSDVSSQPITHTDILHTPERYKMLEQLDKTAIFWAILISLLDFL